MNPSQVTDVPSLIGFGMILVAVAWLILSFLFGWVERILGH